MRDDLFAKWGNRFAGLLLLLSFCACSDGDKTAGGTSEDAGIIAELNVAGVAQKGPFAKGSAVTVQGVDCKTLKFTDDFFEGLVKSDKGDFEIKDVSLSSTCALLEVSGYYLNEVSGKKTKDKLTLRALTDLKERKNVNINLFTSLEYDRVMYLASEKEKSFAKAKEQAQKEVLAAFDIADTEKVAEFESLDIFEKGDGNAALLAVSVLMQGESDVAALAKRLDKFADDFAEDGEWNDSDAKAAIAEWADSAAASGMLDTIRENIESWDYAGKIPAFENVVVRFAETAAPDTVPETLSSSSREKSSSSRDSAEAEPKSSSSGDVEPAEESSSSVTSSSAALSSSALSSATSSSASSSSSALSSSERSEGEQRDSIESKAAFLNSKIKYDSIVDRRDGNVYKTVKIGNQVWMAENLNYADSVAMPSLKGNNWCFDKDSTNCLLYGRLYTWAAATDSQGICPQGWHLPNKAEWELLIDSVGSQSGSKLRSLKGWYNDYNGVDKFGFSGAPAGYRMYAEALECGSIKSSRCASNEFVAQGQDANFWVATESVGGEAYYLLLMYDREEAVLKTHEQTYGNSVRCLKDSTLPASSSSRVRESSSSRANTSSSSMNRSSSSVAPVDSTALKVPADTTAAP